MFVDADSLKALMIYIIVQAKCAKLLVDVICIEEFTPESIKYTNRAYYMTVFHTAFEFLEELSDVKLQELVNSINSRSEMSTGSVSSENSETPVKGRNLATTERRRTQQVDKVRNYSILLKHDYFKDPVERKSSVTDSFIDYDDSRRAAEPNLEVDKTQEFAKSFNILSDGDKDSIQINLDIYKSKELPDVADGLQYTTKEDFEAVRVRKNTDFGNGKLLKPNLFKNNAFNDDSQSDLLKSESEPSQTERSLDCIVHHGSVYQNFMGRHSIVISKMSFRDEIEKAFSQILPLR